MNRPLVLFATASLLVGLLVLASGAEIGPNYEQPTGNKNPVLERTNEHLPSDEPNGHQQQAITTSQHQDHYQPEAHNQQQFSQYNQQPGNPVDWPQLVAALTPEQQRAQTESSGQKQTRPEPLATTSVEPTHWDSTPAPPTTHALEQEKNPNAKPSGAGQPQPEQDPRPQQQQSREQSSQPAGDNHREPVINVINGLEIIRDHQPKPQPQSQPQFQQQPQQAQQAQPKQQPQQANPMSIPPPINMNQMRQRQSFVVQPALQQQQQQQQPQQQQHQMEQPQQTGITLTRSQQVALPVGYQPNSGVQNAYHHSPVSPLYFGHNPFIEILRPLSYADDNIVTLNLSHSHIYEIDSDAFVGQRFEHIDLSNNKLGLIHSKSFRIGPNHSKHNPQFNPHHNPLSGPGGTNNTNGLQKASNNLQVSFASRRPPPSNPKSVTIDFSHNPAIVALSGAFDHIDVPNCLLNFTNSTVELKFGAFKKYFKEHPGHIVEIDSVDCCEQEWLLGYKHNFVSRTHCEHDTSLLLTKVPQQTIIDSCINYVTSARHSMTIQGPSIIHHAATSPKHHANSHQDNQYLTYLILGGTAVVLTSLSVYIIFFMFSLKAAFVYQMQHKS